MIATMDDLAGAQSAAQTVTLSDLRHAAREAKALAGDGWLDESQACARRALETFEASRLPTAWYWRQLVELMQLAGPDRLATELLISRARGTLQLTDRTGAVEWLTFQREIFDALVGMGAVETAIQHAAAIIDALPFELFDEEWWSVVMHWLGHVAEAGLGGTVPDAIIEAFQRAETAADTIAA